MKLPIALSDGPAWIVKNRDGTIFVNYNSSIDTPPKRGSSGGWIYQGKGAWEGLYKPDTCIKKLLKDFDYNTSEPIPAVIIKERYII